MIEQNDKQKHVIQNDEVAGFGRGSRTTLPGFTGAAVLVGCALCAVLGWAVGIRPPEDWGR